MPSESKSADSSLVTVDSSAKVSLSPDVKSFMDTINPLSSVSKMISEMIACRIEIKRLQNEHQRIQNEYQGIQNDYQINSKKVDATLKLALTSLEDRRVTMEHFFHIVENEMSQHHISNDEVIAALKDARKEAMSRDTPTEVKVVIYQTIQILSQTLVSSQQAGSERLNILVQSVKNDLLAVPSLAGLLPPKQ